MAALAAMVLSHALGRSAAVALMALMPYAGDAEHAKAKPLATSVGVAEWMPATGWALGWAAIAVISGALIASRAAAALVAAAAVVLVMRVWLGRRLGGYTGDTLGAAEQFTEVAVLLVLCAA